MMSCIASLEQWVVESGQDGRNKSYITRNSPHPKCSFVQGLGLNFLNKNTSKLCPGSEAALFPPRKVFTYRLGYQSYTNKVTQSS